MPLKRPAEQVSFDSLVLFTNAIRWATQKTGGEFGIITPEKKLALDISLFYFKIMLYIIYIKGHLLIYFLVGTGERCEKAPGYINITCRSDPGIDLFQGLSIIEPEFLCYPFRLSCFRCTFDFSVVRFRLLVHPTPCLLSVSLLLQNIYFNYLPWT
jgi:hypothetical protein